MALSRRRCHMADARPHVACLFCADIPIGRLPPKITREPCPICGRRILVSKASQQLRERGYAVVLCRLCAVGQDGPRIEIATSGIVIHKHEHVGIWLYPGATPEELSFVDDIDLIERPQRVPHYTRKQARP